MSGARWAVPALAAACCLLPSIAYGRAGAILRRADVNVVMTGPTGCEVTAALTLDPNGTTEVLHRLQLFDGASAELVDVTGAARASAAPRLEGRTMVLVVSLDPAGSGAYTIRYRVTQPGEWSYRCPLWVPTTPTDGRSRAIHIQVEVPAETMPTRGAFPAFTWSPGNHGTITIGHVPAFIRVPFRAPGQDPGWWARQDLATVTDATAIIVLVVGSLVWLWRARR